RTHARIPGTAAGASAAASAFAVASDGAVSFRAPEADPAQPLVLTATLWSTVLGGSGDDHARAVAARADGAGTVGGITAGAGFPTTAGAYDMGYNGGTDAFVARLNADGATLVYATFLGGGADETARAIAVGTDGRAIVAGETRSADFPTTTGAYDPSHNGDA